MIPGDTRSHVTTSTISSDFQTQSDIAGEGSSQQCWFPTCPHIPDGLSDAVLKCEVFLLGKGGPPLYTYEFRGSAEPTPSRDSGRGNVDSIFFKQGPDLSIADLPYVKVAQSCPTLCNPIVYIVHGILQNTGVGSLSLLQGIFPTQESNQGLLYYSYRPTELSGSQYSGLENSMDCIVHGVAKRPALAEH